MATVPVTYVSSTSFKLDGDQREYFAAGQKVHVYMGVDGEDEVTTISSSYASGPDETTVTVRQNVLTANLTGIVLGITSPAMLCEHDHTSEDQGGVIPAASLSSDEIDFIQAFEIPGVGDDNRIWRVNDTEDGGEIVDLLGTDDQITVTHNANDTTLALPQDIDTAADVEFGTLDVDDITLNNQTGILEGRDTTNPITAHASSTALQVLRRNAGNDDYEFGDENFEDLADANISGAAQDDIIVRNGSSEWANVPVGEWPNALVVGTDGHVAWGNPGVVIEGTAGEALSQYDIVYTDDTDSGKWKKAQQDGTADEAQARGVVIESGGIADDATGTILLLGLVTNGGWSWTPGATLYLSDTAGTIQEAVPGSGYIIICAQALSATQIFFSPPDTASQTNHAGDHEAGGSDEIEGDLLELSTAVSNFTPTDNTLGGYAEGIDTAIGLAGGAVAIPAPDWCPPAIQWKDADEIYVQGGRYWLGGHRFRGIYQNLTGLASYLDVSARTAVDVDATYSAGTTSGMIDGAKVNDSWYSVWLMASDPILLILPYVRVDTIDYNVTNPGKTTITPAAHDDGTTAENGFIGANDAWNTYRLVKLDAANDASDGEVFTIEDTVDGTPDEVIIDGDQTSYIAAVDWLQLIPPAATDCVYLGDIPIDGDGNLKGFTRTGWRYQWTEEIDVDGHAHATDPGNSDLAPGAPPTAQIVDLAPYTQGNTTTTVSADIYSGITGNNRVKKILISAGSAGMAHVGSFDFMITNPGYIRNLFYKAGPAAADNALIRISGYEL